MFELGEYLGNISEGETLIWCWLGNAGRIKGEVKGNFLFSELSSFVDGVGFHCVGKECIQLW